MLKLLGMFCILSGSTGLGIRFAKELDLRIQELSELQKLMILLKGEIRYMHQPLPEAFLQLSVSAASPLGDFFRHTAEALQRRQGRTAGKIWKENMDQDLKGLHISLREREELEKLGSMLGYLDVEMQMNTLDYYLEQLKLSAAGAAETAKNCRRLYQYMGVLGGAALVILIF